MEMVSDVESKIMALPLLLGLELDEFVLVILTEEKQISDNGLFTRQVCYQVGLEDGLQFGLYFSSVMNWFKYVKWVKTCQASRVVENGW